jgi:hypothetical protein
MQASQVLGMPAWQPVMQARRYIRLLDGEQRPSFHKSQFDQGVRARRANSARGWLLVGFKQLRETTACTVAVISNDNRLCLFSSQGREAIAEMGLKQSHQANCGRLCTEFRQDMRNIEAG